MTDTRMNRGKGILILTEQRSGSTWLASLTNADGRLGRADEWLKAMHFESGDQQSDGRTYAARVIANGSTENGFFAIKLFPSHLFWFKQRFGFDFIRHACENHEVRIVRLVRRDRLRQAISLAKARQTRAWHAGDKPRGETRYDFGLICWCYFRMQRGYGFWDTYLSVSGLEYADFAYEDLLADPAPYLKVHTDHTGIPAIKPAASEMKVLRNDETEEWVARFQEDARKLDVLDFAEVVHIAERRPSNLLRFLRGEEMKPLAWR